MAKRAIILSAGQGSRLYPLTADQPKCLLEVAGRSILDRQLDSLSAAGIDEVVVITGYREAKVLAALERRVPVGPRVEALYNPFYGVADNLGSAWIARKALAGGCLVLNGDTLISAELVTQLLKNLRHPVTVASDIKAAYDDDDMRVEVHGDAVVAIGKTLAVQSGPEAIGLLALTAAGAEAFSEEVEGAIREPAGLSQYYLTVVQRLADRGLVGCHPICGHQWCEVDFPADLDEAEAMLSVPARLTA